MEVPPLYKLGKSIDVEVPDVYVVNLGLVTLYKNLPYDDVPFWIVASSPEILIDQLVVPLFQASFLAAVAPNF